MITRILTGMAAGAAGTTALNAVTYADMVVRARPSSATPEDTVRVAEDAAGVTLTVEGADSDPAANRRSGLGALLGIAAGLTTGAVYGLAAPALDRVPAMLRGALVGLAANVATTGPMTVTGVTDVREWTGDSWPSDLVPHLTYGVVTVAVADALRRR